MTGSADAAIRPFSILITRSAQPQYRPSRVITIGPAPMGYFGLGLPAFGGE
jgi:hypothetical protein